MNHLPSFHALRRRAVLLSAALVLAGGLAAVGVRASQKHLSPLSIKVDETPVSRTEFDRASYADVCSKVAPSVVEIRVREKARVSAEELTPFNDPFFRQFFGGNIPQFKPQPQQGLGSGVIISSDGYIVTNNHVVAGADEVKVTLSDGRDFSAEVVGRDPQTDVAVIKIRASGLPAITFADSTKIRVGDRVLAVGNPFGVGETVTSGIVSATGRQIGILQDVKGLEDFIQTDAAINPGNSGGALVDVQGRLIGINAAILSGSGGFQGVGFAVPSALVSEVADNLIANGHIVRGYLGINIQAITPELQDSFGLKDRQGALVASVEPGGPASRAGLKEGDVIIGVNRQTISNPTDLQLAISALPPGSKLHLEVVRNGASTQIAAVTGSRPGSDQDNGSAVAGDNDQGVLNGVAVDDISPDARQEFNIPESLRGALITNVDPNSAAAQAGISAGDVILDINKHRVDSAQDAVDLSQKATSKKTLVRLWSHGATIFVVVDESQPVKGAS